ncbi:MAG: T9SS type A sorting domain-containing protein [Chitinophagaceae bacterium]|nr:MAG: T9SS type A sorting domain-containing protein [Chitinophagaceae bacterium]
MKFKIYFTLCCFLVGIEFGTAQVHINNAYLHIGRGTTMVITGDHLNRTGGGIIMSASTARVKWFIGNNSTTVQVPFANTALEYLPISIKLRAGASDDGFVSFASYAGPDWKNSNYLPEGVTNVNHNGSDNSSKLIDRFWFVQTGGYTIAPDISSLYLRYADDEINAAGNNILAAGLKAQTWDTTQKAWGAPFNSSTSFGNINAVALSNISSHQKLGWWALTDGAYVLPVTFLSFSVNSRPTDAQLKWVTSSEQNTHHYELQRGADGILFSSIGSVLSAGNTSTPQQYSFTDFQPLDGQSFYRIKIVDANGAHQFSKIERIERQELFTVSAYPNPATDYLSLSISQALLNQRPLLALYDAAAKKVQTHPLHSTNNIINLKGLASGSYQLRISAVKFLKNISIIKQ